jgi:DNA mismatch repair protein MutS
MFLNYGVVVNYNFGMEKSSLTPLMKQYWEIKNQHPDKIVFFRMGDFFELFYEDAQTAAPLLGITLTSRNKKSQEQTPMCGVPHHSVANCINKLLALGLKVAICDQVEDPKLAKGIVKREVTKILTPGMVFDFDTLEASKANFIASFYDGFVFFFDVSTFESFKIQYTNERELKKIITSFDVTEVVCDSENKTFAKSISKTVTIIEKPNKAIKSEVLGGEVLVDYIKYLNPSWNPKNASSSKEVSTLFPERMLNSKLNLSYNTVKHLELFESNKGEVANSLFGIINHTKTAAGARKLKSWLRFPLTNLNLILERQKSLDFFLQKTHVLKKVRDVLAYVSDFERKLAKVDQSQCLVRDIQGLFSSTIACEEILQILNHSGYEFTTKNLQKFIELKNYSEVKNAQLAEEAPLSLRHGGLFKKHVFSDLDEWIELATNSQGLVVDMEQRERNRTGISSLKIRYNQVFGYYIEITNTHSEKVPADYKRKQTLTNAERFYTEELLELEKKVLQAQTRRAELEFNYFEDLKKEILSKSQEFLELAQIISEIDVFTSLAWLALESDYVKPQFVDSSAIIIKEGRHPVIEKVLSTRFIPNSIEIKNNECWLITGPNMAGKSTIMRQVALIQILAQMGSFVPATSCELPLLESIHTRIGASDNLSEGLSTFMVEMVETAEMLKEATSKSLVLLDEIGRGTATYDGLSLAEAIVEFLVNQVKSFTLFATHYHELTEFEKKFSLVKNAHMAISEIQGQIEFLHILKSGPAGKSYGIQVAELAGMPKEVTELAKHYLALKSNIVNAEIENHYTAEVKRNEVFAVETKVSQLALFDQDNVSKEEFEAFKEIRRKINKIDISKTTPLQALIHLNTLKENLETH